MTAASASRGRGFSLTWGIESMAVSNAIRIHKNGGPEELRFENVEVGEPGPDEVRVRHTAIGLNFTDIHHRTGRYPGPGFPLVIGMEAAGVVEAAGAGVRDLKRGDRVAYAGSSPGTYCQLRIMNPARLVKLPDWLDDETAAAVMLKGLTAQYLIRSAYPVARGDTVLIHAAAGGVGLIMCQWARHLGATVIGTVSSPEKAELARAHGCEHPIVSTKEDVAARVRELTGGKMLPVVFDSVGAATFETSLACLRRRGMVVSFGSASGPVPPLDIFRLNRMGSLYVTSAGLADYIAERSELLQRADELFEAVKSGAVRVAINRRYPLAEAARAHRDLEARRTTGSSIILP
jgi:NADPH2:quinone reductase